MVFKRVMVLATVSMATLSAQTHEVKFENQHTKGIRKLIVDDAADLGPLPSGEVSKPIELRPGGHRVFVMLEGGGNVYIDHRFFLRGTRFANWTMRLDSRRQWSLTEDLPESSVRRTVVPQKLPAAGYGQVRVLGSLVKEK